MDARKAYNTVWREYAYTKIHDSGIHGKFWRQLQAMHAGLNRKVRHPLGLTAEFPVERRFAQGAVESPWVYSNLIEGLSVQLKAAGVGVTIAGRKVPLLMYADDIVFLATTPAELVRMNAISTEYARQHRFQFNGQKSGVMAYGVNRAECRRVADMEWELFGEPVMVTDEYAYLGTATPSSAAQSSSWSAHVEASIKKAERRSADLLWVCRADRGIRPRTAITLWQSLVRPQLEYASEFWSGQTTVALARAAEQVQMVFLCGVLRLHANGSGVSDAVIRAEVGCEPLAEGCQKILS